MLTKKRFIALTMTAFLPLELVACSADVPDEESAVAESALEQCVAQNPQVTQVREERPGAVAAGVTKIYFVTVRNMNSTGCAPATLAFVPDSFHFFSISALPSSIGGVASNTSASFRVEVKSDASVLDGTYPIGFTVVGAPNGTSVRGSLTYVVDSNNPTGCNRQAPQIAVAPASPTAVSAGTAQAYSVTVRNVDNVECGSDSFSVIPDTFHLFSVVANGPFAIPAGGSATFGLTATSATTVTTGIYDLGFTTVGVHHGSLTGRGSLRYQVR